MKKEIEIGGIKIGYVAKTDSRSRKIKVAVAPGGIVTVTAPRYAFATGMVDVFMKNKSLWIADQFSRLKSVPQPLSKKDSRREYLAHKERARSLVTDRLAHFNAHYKFPYNRIAIRNQKTRWGSCSTKRNLNFSYRIALLPSHLSDYVIVHELCHLGEFNHSPSFWKLVSEQCPDYKKYRKELKEIKLL